MNGGVGVNVYQRPIVARHKRNLSFAFFHPRLPSLLSFCVFSKHSSIDFPLLVACTPLDVCGRRKLFSPIRNLSPGVEPDRAKIRLRGRLIGVACSRDHPRPERPTSSVGASTIYPWPAPGKSRTTGTSAGRFATVRDCRLPPKPWRNRCHWESSAGGTSWRYPRNPPSDPYLLQNPLFWFELSHFEIVAIETWIDLYLWHC